MEVLKPWSSERTDLERATVAIRGAIMAVALDNSSFFRVLLCVTGIKCSIKRCNKKNEGGCATRCTQAGFPPHVLLEDKREGSIVLRLAREFDNEVSIQQPF